MTSFMSLLRSNASLERTPALLAALALVGSAAPAARAVDLVSTGAIWKYLDDGSDQGTAWSGTDFVDGGWDSGPAQLGYGDGDEATVVNGGPVGDRFITTYFRHTFIVADPGSVAGLELRILRDDGAVIHLNGTEIIRTNMPGGEIDYQTLSATTIGGADELVFHAFPVSPGMLVPGDNLLAVEIHQRSSTSSDISFDLELATTAAPGVPSIVRGPYLQVGAPTSMVVRWRTNLATESHVHFGRGVGTQLDIVSETVFTTDHEVEITGLYPYTRYFYSVGDGTSLLAGPDADQFFVTSPLPDARQWIRFWVIGDSGACAVSAQGCLDAVAVADAFLDTAGSADGWLMLGDNAYNTGTDAQHTAAIFDTYPNILRNTVLWPSPGNHEFGASDSPTQTGPYYEAFSMPTAGEAGGVSSGTEAYYSFDYGNVHFVALDSHDTDRSAPSNPTTNICPLGQGGAMYQWLCADLAATYKDWLIVFWHHPPYTKGSHNSDTEGQLIDIRERFVPVLEHYGVDLHLSGHSHSYERSVLIDGHYGDSSTFSAATHEVDGGDGDPLGDGSYVKPTLGPSAHEGTVYSVVGSSSKNSGGLTLHAAMQVAINYEGSLLFDVDGNVLDGYWIDRDGVIGDVFQIVKGSTSDGDADGVPDADDNCMERANAVQCDTDQDGYGNACDADYDDDMRVGVPDFNGFRAEFGLDIPPGNGEMDHDCDGTIAISDFNSFRSLFGGPPGRSGLTCAGAAPCSTP